MSHRLSQPALNRRPPHHHHLARRRGHLGAADDRNPPSWLRRYAPSGKAAGLGDHHPGRRSVLELLGKGGEQVLGVN